MGWLARLVGRGGRLRNSAPLYGSVPRLERLENPLQHAGRGIRYATGDSCDFSWGSSNYSQCNIVPGNGGTVSSLQDHGFHLSVLRSTRSLLAIH